MAASASSFALRKLPVASVRARTERHCGVLPTTLVVQLVLPLSSSRDVLWTGATPAMSGAAVFDVSTSASETVRVEAEPKPPRTPLELVELPGDTMSRLLPSALI